MSLIPQTNDKYIGIEIECISLQDEESVWDLVRQYKLGKYVDVDDDGSINTSGMFDRTCPECGGSGRVMDSFEDDHGNSYEDSVDCNECDGTGTIDGHAYSYELKLLIKQTELKIVLSKVKLLLKAMGAKVNSSCGLHVHLDMRNRKFTDSVTKLLNVQGIMIKSVPKSRRNNTYCRPVTKDLTKNLSNISKYHAIHTEDCMKTYRTIEVRIHEGTVDTEAIFKWVKFLIATVDGNFATKKIRTTTALPIRVQKYIKERMASAL